MHHTNNAAWFWYQWRSCKYWRGYSIYQIDRFWHFWPLPTPILIKTSEFVFTFSFYYAYMYKAQTFSFSNSRSASPGNFKFFALPKNFNTNSNSVASLVWLAFALFCKPGTLTTWVHCTLAYASPNSRSRYATDHT